MTTTATVGEDYPVQQARMRECLARGTSIGPAGAFYVAMVERISAQADRAMAGGDIVEILAAYRSMVELQE